MYQAVVDCGIHMPGRPKTKHLESIYTRCPIRILLLYDKLLRRASGHIYSSSGSCPRQKGRGRHDKPNRRPIT